MTPATLNLDCYTGATFGPVVITCLDSGGDPVDLTGWSAWAEVRTTAAGDVVLDLAPEITDEEAGEITIELTDEDTTDIPVGSYRWDLLLENPDGDRLGPYVTGKFVVKPIITQPAYPET